MTTWDRIRKYLDERKVSYEELHHPLAFTASEVAQTLHVPGKTFAKSVIVDADGRRIMAVLPATCHVNLKELKDFTGAKQVRLVTEGELSKICEDCELGAFPPFGNLYGMEVWLDSRLEASEEIAFNAGTHRDALRLKYSDYRELVKPVVAHFGEAWAA